MLFFKGGKSYEELKKELGGGASPVCVTPVRMRSRKYFREQKLVQLTLS